MTESTIHLDGLSRLYGRTVALADVSVRLDQGAFSVLLGPSGCGKSTLLRLIAGLDRPSAGAVRIGGCAVTDLPPVARNLSMVFQSYALFPHLSVRDNILFGLAVRGCPRPEREDRLARVAAMMELETLLGRKPSELSGGQQQRVALARAVISERPICLMDEPLSNLDARLRAEMRVELRALQRRLGLTVVYVTHDQVEAMTMADRIVVMNQGRIEQVGTPEAIYARPATAFVAGFIGTPAMNLVPAALLRAAGAALPDLPHGALAGLRPEDLRLGPAGPQARPGAEVPAQVVGQEYLGADRIITLDLHGTRLLLRLPASDAAPQGAVGLSWPEGALHLFDGSTGARLAGALSPVPSPP